MPALNFKAQFAPLVESGEKSQTIRKVRKHPIKAGDRLFLFTGMRTKQCRKLRETVCTNARMIAIQPPGGVIVSEGIYLWEKGQLSTTEAKQLARKDGFSRLTDFVRFFKDQYGLPFEGVLIEWD